MREFDFGGRRIAIDCNGLTPFWFSEEFTYIDPKGIKKPDDINRCAALMMEAQNEFGIPPMIDMLKLFWALAKTANPKLGGFKKWLADFPADEMMIARGDGWANEVMDELSATIFRSPKKDVAAKAR